MKKAGLHVTVSGPRTAPRIVFLHGFLGSGADWQPLAKGLRDRYRIECVDLPGHGHSARCPANLYRLAATRNAVRKLARGATVLIGYSMGGRVALAAALKGVVGLRALVLISASPGLDDRAKRAQRCRDDQALAACLESDGRRAFLEQWYQQPLFASLRTRPHLLREILARRARGNAAAMARALRGLSVGNQPNLWPALPRLRLPVLWMAGAEDATYAECARRAAGLSPRASRTILPRCGHMPHLERPAAAAGALLQFLEQHVEST